MSRPRVNRSSLFIAGAQMAAGAVGVQILSAVLALLYSQLAYVLLVFAIMAPIAAISGFAVGCWSYWYGWHTWCDIWQEINKELEET